MGGKTQHPGHELTGRRTIATKPYVSSANYINKMSDYCRRSATISSKNPMEKTRALFNSLLVLGFSSPPPALLEKNARIGMMYRTWDKKTNAEKDNILAQAALYKETLETL
ncbi:MAG: hypothetical protein R2875_14390 [Desulfobacterales bacterium]